MISSIYLCHSISHCHPIWPLTKEAAGWWIWFKQLIRGIDWVIWEKGCMQVLACICVLCMHPPLIRVWWRPRGANQNERETEWGSVCVRENVVIRVFIWVDGVCKSCPGLALGASVKSWWTELWMNALSGYFCWGESVCVCVCVLGGWSCFMVMEH